MSVAGVIVSGPAVAGSETILTEKSLELVALLHRNFNARRLELLCRTHPAHGKNCCRR